MKFATNITPYAKGRRYDAQNWNAFSRTAEGAIGFGVPVSRGAADRTIVEGIADVIGISETVQVLPHTGDGFVQYDTVPVSEWGVIGVDVGTATVADGAPAAWNPTTKLWGAVAAGFTAVAGAVFETSGTGIVLVRYDLRIGKAPAA